ncbi:hypothetical protein JW916_03780 [Candidatus Sumerlaeota bacterium]|nr:hypothetical protein [Candidatus Sumerlaeota bacterium]
MNSRRFILQRAIRPALSFLLCATIVAPPCARAQTPVDESAEFEAYRALDRLVLEGPDAGLGDPFAPAAVPPSPEHLAIPEIPSAAWEDGGAAAPLEPVGAETLPLDPAASGEPPRGIPSASPAPSSRIVRLLDQIPSCAVIDLESETLTPAETAAVTQVVWNEVQRAGRARLADLSATRHLLAERDLTPSDPYRMPPSWLRLADALSADYLVMGNVNRFGKTYVNELLLYSASSNSIVRSRASQSDAGFDGLLREIPAMAHDAMNAVPLRVLATDRSRTSEPDRPSRLKTMVREIEQLRAENDRQHKQIEELQSLLEKSGAAMPETRTSSIVPAAQPRYGNKSAKRMKAYRPPTRAAQPEPPEPKAVSTPEATLTEPPPPAIEPAHRDLTAETRAEEAPPPLSYESLTNRSGASVAEPPEAASPPETTEEPAATMERPEGPPAFESPLGGEDADAPSPQVDPGKAERFFTESEKYPVSSKEGIIPLERALKLHPDNPRYRMELVTRLYFTRQYEQCVARGKEFLGQEGADPNLNHFIAAAYYETKNYKEALDVIAAILERDPRDMDGLYNRALNLAAMNDAPKAIEAYRRYLEVARGASDARHVKYIQEAEEALQKIEAQVGKQ